MSWRTTQTEDNIVHVIPLNDKQEHDEYVCWPSEVPASGCRCGAISELSKNNVFIIIHSSFDGREGLEWVKDILNK